MFVTLRDGLSSLVERLAARLPAGSVRLNSPVERIERIGDAWRIFIAGTVGRNGRRTALSRFRRPDPGCPIIRSRPGCSRPVDGTLADELGQIEHSGTAIVSLGYERQQVGHPLDGMGAVVPAVEDSPILAVSFSSQKYPHRAPEGKVLLRVFVGGARRPDWRKCPTTNSARW